jgi:TRAP-type C4-dicarboxylate transport system permease small subunit
LQFRCRGSRRESAVAQLFSLGIMRTPVEKMKKADRRLMVAMMFCLILALIIEASLLHSYITHQLQDWDKPIPIESVHYFMQGMRYYVYMALPVVGIGYLFVAYAIWNYRRKRGAIKDHDKPDA